MRRAASVGLEPRHSRAAGDRDHIVGMVCAKHQIVHAAIAVPSQQQIEAAGIIWCKQATELSRNNTSRELSFYNCLQDGDRKRTLVMRSDRLVKYGQPPDLRKSVVSLDLAAVFASFWHKCRDLA
ncbi:hypothetical protein [Bradyrhizobium sp. Ai1a-2]|uniref:hypothetical protein n=1 Tax=Bradyrhizobium sp. Ai1a-2 TaxID=196490 RepID=UPI001267B92A|nr:hypothetical protein [Bradyrhizobium sp. Ai1a-2]